jgi:hypothetical protein
MSNETLASTETALRCAIFGAWPPYFISQFMLQKRGFHGKIAYINAVINAVYIPLSLVDTQTGTFLIKLSSRQYDSHLCCQDITSNFSNIHSSCKNINPHM